MDNVSFYITIFLSFFMIGLGYFSLTKKLDFLYKDLLTKVKKKKSIIDKEGLKIFSGIGLIVMGIEMLLLTAFAYFKMYELASFCSFAICFTSIYMFGASQRYDSTNYVDGKMKLKTKIAIVFVSILILSIYFLIITSKH